jgi:MYXO-CTERM domain-containing protein
MALLGKIGGGLEFNDSNDHIDFGDIAAMSSQGAFSVSMWFNRDVDRTDATNHNVDNVLIAKSSNSKNDNFELGTDGANAEVYIDSTAGADATATYAVGVQDDVWHHVVLTYDPARDPGDEMVLYLDGSQAASDNRWGGNLDQSNGSPLTLGMARPDNQNWGDFDGMMDDVAIWSRAITPAEIAALYNGGTGAPASSLANFSDGIVLYTPMDSLDYALVFDQQGGVLAPGASAGISALLADYVMGEDAIYEVELGAPYVFDPTNLPTLTDFIYVGGQADLEGALDILNLAGFDPRYGDVFDILTATNGVTNPDLSGVTFGFTSAPTGLYWWRSIVPLEGEAEALRLEVSPEPATLTLLGLGALALIRRRRKA